jgi:hypothetical protein
VKVIGGLNYLVLENEFCVLVGESHQVSAYAGDGDGEDKGRIEIHHVDSPEEPWNKET